MDSTMLTSGRRPPRGATHDVSYVYEDGEDGNEKKEGRKKKKEKTDLTQKSNRKATELMLVGGALTESEKKAIRKMLWTVLLTSGKMLSFKDVLTVAREGCVDETLSAIAAALEVEHITEVLNKDVDSLYSTIDRDILVFIRDELVKIAIDESNHSALAWRTMNWVCTVNHDACESVYTDVFDESKLEIRFRQRAKGSFGHDNLTLDSMRGEWKKLFNIHRLALESKS